MSARELDEDSSSGSAGGGLMVPLLLAAPDAGKAAQGVVRLGVEALGTAGTGARIAALRGVARSNATLAAIGGGPKALGGLGVSGGNARLNVIGGAVTAIAVGAVIAGTFCIHKFMRPSTLRNRSVAPVDPDDDPTNSH